MTLLLSVCLPSAGTTWIQEVVYLIHNGVNVEEAASLPITERVPFIDYNRMWPLVTSMTSPRLLKSHLQASYFRDAVEKKKVKVVVMMRNPKDTLVSFYHFYQVNIAFGGFRGTWHEFYELVRERQLIYGDWFDYTLGWWKLKDNPNVLIIKYEDMKIDPTGNIRKVAKFCGKELNEDEIQKVVEHTSFKKMKENKSVNYTNRSDFLVKGTNLMRKGSTGGWTDYFTVAQNRHFDDVYAQRVHGTGLDFIFEM